MQIRKNTRIKNPKTTKKKKCYDSEPFVKKAIRITNPNPSIEKGFVIQIISRFFFFKPRIQVKKIEWRVFVPKKAPSSGRTKIIDEKAADFFGGKKNMKVNLKRLVI